MDMGKKGNTKVNGAIDSAVGAVVVIAIVAALSPTIFGDLQNINTTSGAPSWLQTVLVIVVAVGLLYLVWRLFMK